VKYLKYSVYAFNFFLLIYGVSNADNIISTNEPTIRIGYFHGGRTNMIYKASTNGYFDSENINVELYTKDLSVEGVYKIPDTHNEYLIRNKLNNKMRKKNVADGTVSLPPQINVGKMRGTEIVDHIVNGDFEAGTIGECSFLIKIIEGAPIVAVSLLGFEREPGKAILLHKDVTIHNKSDWLGKILAARRAGPSDFIYLMEFLEAEGIKENKINIIHVRGVENKEEVIKSSRKADMVNVVPQIDEYYHRKWLKDGFIDGGLYHLLSVIHEKRYNSYIYRSMDWMKPSMPQALLVFHRDYVQQHPEMVQKVVNGYMKRLNYENKIPYKQRADSWDKGAIIKGTYKGLWISTYIFPPKINIGLLNDMQKLLVKYNFIKDIIDITPYINESFVHESYAAYFSKP